MKVNHIGTIRYHLDRIRRVLLDIEASLVQIEEELKREVEGARI